MKIAVVGVGYVGLATAACLATKFTVVGIDVDEGRVSSLAKGRVPIHEKGLERLLKAGISKGRLSFSSRYDALDGADYIFLAVGTPGNGDGSIDLTQVKNASMAIGERLEKSTLRPVVVVKSTVVPGTTEDIVKPILESQSGKEVGHGFGLCSNPEFLREGSAIGDTLRPDRIVVGTLDPIASKKMGLLYSKFYGPKAPPMVFTTPSEAELVKYASNAFLATKLSLINFVARLCEQIPGADVNRVAAGMGLDPRIGGRFLQAGPGWGGSCFPKDLRALLRYSELRGLDSPLLEAVLGINDSQPGHALSLSERAAGPLKEKQVAVLGLAFKAGTDDVRDSRSLVLLDGLLDEGVSVRVYDPVAMENAKKELGERVQYCRSARECIEGADLAIVMTAWDEFKKLKPSDYLKLMRTPVLLDARRVYDPARYSRELTFLAVGLGPDGGERA